MSTYAKTTTVSSSKTIMDIEKVLKKYGAEEFIYGTRKEAAVVLFKRNGKQVRLTLPLPDPQEFRFTPNRGIRRTEAEKEKCYEQAIRQKWRALLLVITAKLEAVEAGIAVFEEEFLSYMVLPDNRTVGQFYLPQIETIYQQNKMPPMLDYGQSEAVEGYVL